MNSLKSFVLALVVAFAFSVTFVTSAFASGGWGKCVAHAGGHYKDSLCNEATGGGFEFENFPTTVAVNWEGKLEVEDSGLSATKIGCEETEEGTVGSENSDEITKVTISKCKLLKGLCSEGTIKASPIDLPWSTTLEPVSEEVRDKIESSGAGAPGWSVECNTIVGKITDTCSGETTAAVKNIAAGVETVYDSKSAHVNCSIGGANTGVISGNVTAKNPAATQLVAVLLGRLFATKPKAPSKELKFLEGETQEVEIAFSATFAFTKTSKLIVKITNEENGPYGEVPGETCVGLELPDTGTCKFKIKLNGKPGKGKVTVDGGTFISDAKVILK